MHILYVALEYEYGMKRRGPNVIGERGFKNVFESLGHKVTTFYYDKYLGKIKELQEDIIEMATKSKPDLIYFIMYSDQFQIETLQKLKSIAITVNWFGDDQWRFDNFTQKYGPEFSWCITTDPFCLSKYKKAGIANVHLSQWAAINDEVKIPKTVEYKYDVSFIGGSHSFRRWFVDELRNRGINVETFGFNWPNGTLAHEKMIEVFQQSKINLNLSNSVSFDIRYLKHNIKNPIVAWRSPKSSSQIKARNFEIPYYGGFQLAEYVPGLDRYLEIGKEVACYKDVDEAALLIRHYLDNNDLRERQKTASMVRARNNHTYFHRHKDFFEVLK